MNHTQKQFRILAIALSARGLSFAVMEGEDSLVAWGGKQAEGDKNAQALAKAEKLLDLYKPGILVLQDMEAKGSHRYPRMKRLNRQIIKAAGTRKIKVTLISGERQRSLLLGDTNGTKHEMAEMLAQRFPVELGSRLPAKRREWESESSRMGIFDAAALAVAFRMRGIRH